MAEHFLATLSADLGYTDQGPKWHDTTLPPPALTRGRNGNTVPTAQRVLLHCLLLRNLVFLGSGLFHLWAGQLRTRAASHLLYCSLGFNPSFFIITCGIVQLMHMWGNHMK